MRFLIVCLIAVLAFLCVPAMAEVQTNISTDINLAVLIPCTGDTVLLSGPLHTLITATVNGNNVSGKVHFQPQGISGTDQSTGAKYQGTGVTQQNISVSLQNGQANFTVVNNFKIIGQGTSANYTVHQTVHITFNANGTATANVDNTKVVCK